MVVVVLTLSGRDDPRMAYTTIGTMAVYRPTCSGSCVMVAKAIALGTTTAAVVSPAVTSGRSHAREYVRSQPRLGIRCATPWQR